MGLFDAFADLASATVKTVLTPVAIVADAAMIVTGNEADVTKSTIVSIGDDLASIPDDLMD